MRVAAAVLAGFGALVSLYVPLEAFQNNFGTGLPTPPSFLLFGVVFALVGAAGARLTWRGSTLGTALLLLGTIGGLVAWPWLTPALIYLFAAAASATAVWIAHRATGSSSRFA